MLFGPLPVVFAEKLRQLLQAQGADGKIYHAQDEESRAVLVDQDVSGIYPVYRGRDQVHIEIEQKDLLIVRGELEKMGFSVPARVATPIPGDDFLCPTCDYHGDAAGPCPKDGTQLLPFVEWAEQKRLRNRRRDRIFAWIVLSIMAVAALIRAYVFLTGSAPNPP